MITVLILLNPQFDIESHLIVAEQTAEQEYTFKNSKVITKTSTQKGHFRAKPLETQVFLDTAPL